MTGGIPGRDEHRIPGIYAKSMHSQQGHPRHEGHPSCSSKASRDFYQAAMIYRKMLEANTLMTMAKFIYYVGESNEKPLLYFITRINSYHILDAGFLRSP